MKMYLVHYFTVLLLLFAGGCEYPYGSRKEVVETSEAELIRTLTMLQGYFEKLEVSATPMKIVHTRNRATLRIGRAYSRYLYDTASPIIVPADTLATVTHREDITWDYFSLSLKSISIEDKLLSDGKRIKAVIV